MGPRALSLCAKHYRPLSAADVLELMCVRVCVRRSSNSMPFSKSEEGARARTVCDDTRRRARRTRTQNTHARERERERGGRFFQRTV